jgi:hypothetical protein
METKRWQDRATLALGIGLFVSPWVLQFFRDIGLRSLNFEIVGAALAALAVLELRRRTLWSEWLTLVLGLWAIGAPWLLGFASSRPATVDSAAVGTRAGALSIWVILRYTPNPGEVRDFGR